MRFFSFIALCFLSIAVSDVFGFSENAGLFGAILSGGCYIILLIENRG